MKPTYFSKGERLLSCILLISLSLQMQSCGGIHNTIMPIQKKQPEIIQNNIHPSITTINIAPLAGQALTAQGDHTVRFYVEADKLRASVEENLPVGFSRTHKDLPVYLAADVDIAKVASLSEVEQKRLIEVHLPKSNQPGHVYLGKRGLLGGMREGKNIPDECLCPITHEIMEDPVIAQDGHTYERAAIQGWFDRGHRNSPMTGGKVLSIELVPNYTMRSLIKNLKETNSVLARHQLDTKHLEAVIKLREEEFVDKWAQKGHLVNLAHEIVHRDNGKGKGGIQDLSIELIKETTKDFAKDYVKMGLTAMIGSAVVGGGALIYEIGLLNSFLAAGLTATTATALYFVKNRKRKRDHTSSLSPSIDAIDGSKSEDVLLSPEGKRLRISPSLEVIDINKLDEDNNTSLHIAASEGDLDRVKALLEKGADVNITGKYGNTPIHLATEEGHLEIVKLLLERGADINTKNRYSIGCTPLILAARGGYLEITKLLLERGADINGKNKIGRLSKYGGPLHEATESGHLEVVKLLLEKGADVNARRQGVSFSKSNYDIPLHLAIGNGHLEVVKVLIGEGADVHKKGLKGYPLYLAVEQEDIEMVKLLLEKRVDINCKNEYSYSDAGTASAHTPLHRAACNGNIALIRLLIDKGAHVDPINSYQDTPLHLAVKGGHLEVVKYLIEKGAGINSRNIYGNASIFYAIEKKHTEIVKLLLRKGVNLNFNVCINESFMDQGKEGSYSLLHWATSTGDVEVVKLLLAKRANINIQDQDGKTPLHWSVNSTSLDLVKLLIENGADPNVKDNKGTTPMKIASRKRKYKTELIELLSKKE
ncbi:hypothetical protein Aasi_0393 [Candidatus Amoebophilus asiaticus 5a2]|uniref:U-box domain-containing protein n=1 Tax=Amoebophilus asiaticus (strain 5a2) TaxID=452471 RepID=B3ERG1_AMOA5|nr:ankyrin repeat domain-containing protein [Candidatus Amoebophilus asiaticus]ACE05813.1 hypothetical protein Aasi_0393 [Candidatus Amoebophilus asiaticus 5a2]